MNTKLSARARRYALIIRLLYARQQLVGQLQQVRRGARHLAFGVRLSDPMQLDNALKLSEPLALASGCEAVLAQRVEGLISYQVQLPHLYWEYYTRADVTGLQVGLAEQRRPVEFELSPPHVLIAGTTGAGKSETLKSILIALVTSYTPDQLGLVIIDPHHDYAAFQNEAHLLLPVASEADEMATALRWINQELARRRANNIRDGKLMVVAVDEADEALAEGVNLQVARVISQQARKYRIHLLVATRKPLHAQLPGILDNLMNKWIGQLSDAQTSARVTGHAGLMAHKLTPKGDFLHITGPEVARLQIAMATAADFERLERTEVKPVAVKLPAPIELPPTLPGAPPVGRPRIELDPEILAAYFYYGPQAISHRLAREQFGLARTGHLLHRDFCQTFGRAYLRLRQTQKNIRIRKEEQR